MRDKFIKVKCGAVVREIPKGALKWYLAAKWRVVEDEIKTNTKKITSK